MRNHITYNSKLHRFALWFGVMISIILCVICLIACGNEEKDPSVYTADELKYVSESGAVMCETRDRKFYKAYSDPAVYGYIITEGNFDNGNIGPLLIGKTPDSVAYYTSISCTIFTNAETIEYKGETYYYSIDEEFCYTDTGWKHNGSSHLSMYVCKAQDRKSGAEEILKIANLSKLETDGGLLKNKEHVGEIDKIVYEFGGHYYSIFDEPKDWLSAELYCESIGGHLATITSAEEDKFVHALITDVGSRDLSKTVFAIGGHKSNENWTWITKEKFDYTNFGTGEPNGTGAEMVYYFSSGYDYSFKWDDSVDNRVRPYICEWESRDLIGGSVDYYPNKITTVAQLKAIAGSTQTFALGADIDLSDEENWAPINGFSGRLIGNGRKIINLTINAVNVKNIGLFSELTGTVQDLIVENAQITAKGDAGYAGIIAGTNHGVIKGVKVSGTVNPTYYSRVGGLVGYNNCGTINDCVNQATVVGVNKIGGIAGSMTTNANGQIDRNINEGEIAGTDNVGGIVGYLTCVRSNATYQVSNNTNRNTVKGSNRVGGIFGEVYAFYQRHNYDDYNSYFSMSLLVNQAEVSGKYSGNDTGGLIGKATRLTVMTTCENAADVSGGVCVGGFVGYAPDTNIKAAGAINNNAISGQGKVGGFAGHAGLIEYAVNNGEISSAGAMVEDGATRAYTGGIAGYCTGIIGCENNSDIKVQNAGAFVGGLAGYIVVSASNRVNNNLNTGCVTGADSVGGIAGYLTCVRSNATYQCSDNINKNSVTGASDVGGIFGKVYAFYERYNYNDYNSYFSVSLLVNEGEVKGAVSGSDVGGLIGEAERLTILTVSENKADVTGGNYVGGFLGDGHSVNIKASGAANNNTIIGEYAVGGIAGRAGIVENAVNNGDVFANGKDADGFTWLGGVVGRASGVIGCVNNMDISINHDGKHIGGIAGRVVVSTVNAVRDNVNNGKVSGSDFIGGVAGYVTCVRSNATYSIKNNINRGQLSGKNNIGGICGFIYAFYERYNYNDYNSYFEVTYCQNEGMVSGSSRVGGIVGGYERLKTDNNLISTNVTVYGNILGQ